MQSLLALGLFASGLSNKEGYHLLLVEWPQLRGFGALMLAASMVQENCLEISQSCSLEQMQSFPTLGNEGQIYFVDSKTLKQDWTLQMPSFITLHFTKEGNGAGEGLLGQN